MKNWNLTSIIDYYLCLFILELMPFLNMIICAGIIISVIADKLTLEDAVRWVTLFTTFCASTELLINIAVKRHKKLNK